MICKKRSEYCILLRLIVYTFSCIKIRERDGLGLGSNSVHSTGGVTPDLRPEAWCFLFGVFPCHSTTSERDVLRTQLAAKFEALKDRWQACLLKVTAYVITLSKIWLNIVKHRWTLN